MQQKVTKMKRQRRAWARPLSRKSGTAPNRTVIDQYKMSARGLMIDEKEVDALAAKILKKEGGTPIEKRDTPARVAALKRQAELERKLPDGCDLSFRGPGPTNLYQESIVYFNARRTSFVILYKDLRKKEQRRSASFPSKELLILYWNEYWDKITWVEITPLE